MKHLRITTIAAVLLVGCGESVPDDSIYKAAKEGDIEAVKQHLDAGADVNVRANFGRTPLHSAAGRGHKEIAELLVAAGANVNANGIWGWTPLHRAADESHKEVAKLLLTKGADVNAKDREGKTPLDKAEKVEDWQSSETKAAKKEIADLGFKLVPTTGTAAVLAKAGIKVESVPKLAKGRPNTHWIC
jgi:ankyrin repeat protein